MKTVYISGILRCFSDFLEFYDKRWNAHEVPQNSFRSIFCLTIEWNGTKRDWIIVCQLSGQTSNSQGQPQQPFPVSVFLAKALLISLSSLSPNCCILNHGNFISLNVYLNHENGIPPNNTRFGTGISTGNVVGSLSLILCRLESGSKVGKVSRMYVLGHGKWRHHSSLRWFPSCQRQKRVSFSFMGACSRCMSSRMSRSNEISLKALSRRSHSHDESGIIKVERCKAHTWMGIYTFMNELL